MFGQNEVRHADLNDGWRLQVAEIFFTLQGEGPFSGQRAVFIRLTGCNLRCTFCDTKWDDKRDHYMLVADVVRCAHEMWEDNTAGMSPAPLFVITGGEPLRQNIEPLIHQLLNVTDNARVQIETAGTIYQNVLSLSHVTVVVSPKTPQINRFVEICADAYKYVISDVDTFTPFGIPIASTQPGDSPPRPLASPRRNIPIYVTPCDPGEGAFEHSRHYKQNLVRATKLALDHGFILNLQLHKYARLP